ncbi:MAG: DUF2061 domain-containing protein [Gammaproteobacteria bacterium]|nr:DUF2061 domain-containing protein [Gammaproteobacteria bacterium]
MFLFNRAAPSATATAAGEKPIRSLAKAASWRVTGSIDTMLLSWLFTGDLGIAAAIGLTEVVTKMFLYYLHERAWNRIELGRNTRPAAAAEQPPGAEPPPVGERQTACATAG